MKKTLSYFILSFSLIIVLMSPLQLEAATSLQSLETSVFNQINNYRKSKGLPALTNNSYMTQVARGHSYNMASGKVKFGHDGFHDRATLIKQNTGQKGAVAENVAHNYGYKDPATKAVNDWIKSDGHRKNIVGNYKTTGIGIAYNSGHYYLTQVFAY